MTNHGFDTFSSTLGWRCPLCNATAYRQTLVGRPGHPDGRPYLTEFFECTGCTVMFRHPNRFARLGIPTGGIDLEPRTLRDVHGLAVEPEHPVAANDSRKSESG